MSRLVIENIVERARDVRHVDGARALVRAALLDITLDVALTMVTNTNKLVQQNYAGSKVRLRLIRKLRTDWRAIVKGVKLLYDDHPISDRHLYVTLAAYYPSLIRDGGDEVFDDQLLTSDEHFLLQRCSASTMRSTVHAILSRVS